MYVDYHNHTVLCHHAEGSVDEYLGRARALGFAEFGFSEHSYWMVRHSQRQLCPSRAEMDLYLEWMDERLEKYDGRHGMPKLRVGLEVDWVPDRMDEASAFVDAYPFDYLLGSVHHLHEPDTGQWIITWNRDEHPLEEMYEQYFGEVAKLARSGCCDILAHLDVILRCGRVPACGVLPYIRKILPDIVASGVAVEINTSGLDHPNRSFFPGQEALRLLVQSGVPITFGSDSHRPAHVGRYWKEAVEYLRAAGGTHFVRFEQRRKLPTPLPPPFSLPDPETAV